MTRGVWLLAALPLLISPLQAQQFGAYVGILGDDVLVAEPTLQRRPATIHVYSGTNDGWEETDALAAPPHEGGDYFGRFFVMDEQSFVVGGTLYDDSTGAIWVYRRNGEELEFVEIVQPEEISPEESFGRFGELYGDLLFVSSLGYQGVGAVWVFERDAEGSFARTARLEPEDPAEMEFFGWDLAFDGERLLVGSFAGEAATGAAYVFFRDDDGDWSQEARLALPENESAPADVGTPGVPGGGDLSVGWFQGMALLGLPGRALGEGAVYTFTRGPQAGSWVRGTTLSAFDRLPSSFFGHALNEIEGELWVSAPRADYAGAIYRFAWNAETASFGAATKIRNTLEPDEGDGFGSTVAASGDLAIVGQPGDDGGLGSAIVMRREGESWISEAKLLIPGEPGLPTLAGGEIFCSEDGQADRYPCSNVDILSFLPVNEIGGGRGIETNDIWGWTDPGSGREYALVGRTDGTAFVDVTDPVSPVYLGNLPKTPGSPANSWRDIKVYDDHAFVVADGSGRHGMQVFDLTRLRDVEDPPARFEPDALYRGIASAHNIVINEETATAYAVGSNSGGETCGGGLHMIDISEPLEPNFVGCFQDRTTGRGNTGYSHDAMCIVYRGPDEEHAGREVCFGANETGLSIADVTDRDSPVALSSASYPSAAYAHQGWITEDHRYFYLGDELDEGGRRGEPDWSGTRTLIWDVSDLDDPVLVKEHFGEVFTTDHNLYIRGNLMYQSNYMSGLRILNISDPENPVEVGYLDTVPDRDSPQMDGSWGNYPYFESGTIAVTSQAEGVFFLRYRPPELLP